VLFTLVLLAVLATNSAGLVRGLGDNLLMVAGLKDYRFPPVPAALVLEEHSDLCGRELLLTIVQADRSGPFTSPYALRWAAVCHVALDLQLRGQLERPTDRLFAGSVALRVAGLIEALSIWRERPDLTGYFAAMAAEKFAQKQEEEALQYLDLAAGISLDALQDSYPMNRMACLHYRRLELWAQALPYCEAGADLQGAERDWQILGLVQTELGLYQDALHSYTQVGTPAARYEQAQLLQALGHSDRAERDLLELMNEDSDLRGKATLGLIQLYLDEDRRCDARNLVTTVFSDACARGDGSVPRRYCRLLTELAPADCK
jgi:hypothetical protein